MKILINHVGYDTNGHKLAVVEAPAGTSFTGCSLINKDSEEKVYTGPLKECGPVKKWKNWYFWTFDFSEVTEPGNYYIDVEGAGRRLFSDSFRIEAELIRGETLSDVLYFFKTQRCSGRYDRKDRNAAFYGDRTDTVDAHGGWYDASGDYSKYLSHLSYANYLNPQQTPMTVWALLDAFTAMKKREGEIPFLYTERFMEEALHGADFLVRMQDKEGFFYAILFDQWSKELDKRLLCTYSTKKGIRSESYQAAYRQGGGVTIAALARMSTFKLSADFSPAEYLQAAEKGFAHLEEHNVEYLPDGKENIIDDYCALLAALELYDATGKSDYLTAANRRAENLMARISEDSNYKGWWRADDSGEHPYFHAAEAGLPVISLIRYLEVVSDSPLKGKIEETIKTALEFELTITGEVTNPFGYSRQYVRGDGEDKKGAFFVPHNNPSGYWWQGENARLGSIAAAARKGAALFAGDESFAGKLNQYATNQLNWILGLNPYDICMLHGKGRNNVHYELGLGLYNAPGGVINGITGGFKDEDDIDFRPEEVCNDGDHSWRWGEQWLPHPTWYLLAVAH